MYFFKLSLINSVENRVKKTIAGSHRSVPTDKPLHTHAFFREEFEEEGKRREKKRRGNFFSNPFIFCLRLTLHTFQTGEMSQPLKGFFRSIKSFFF
jgi:hypothetical protein